MKQWVFENSVEVFRAAPEPHFDDERTVLSARPVVPLKEIRGKLRHRKLWLLSGAFSIAILLGAATALLAVYMKLEGVAKPATEVSKLEGSQADGNAAEPEVSAPVAVGEALESYSPVIENMEGEQTRQVAQGKQLPLAGKHRVTARSDSDANQRVGQPELTEDDALQRIREEILVDQWQERRLRRAARRERRGTIDRGDRDVFHVDEIFEGARRPQ